MPELRLSNCTRYRFRYSECTRCADACPHAAIRLGDEGAALVADKCTECGLCISACRTQAWSSETFRPIDILRYAIQGPQFSLACEPSGYKANRQVPCLGAVDAVWLAYMAKRGIPVDLLGSDHCGECPHGKTGERQLGLNLDAVSALAAAGKGSAADPSTTPVWHLPHLVVPDKSSRSTPRVDPAKEPGKHARRHIFQKLFRRPLTKGDVTPGAAKTVTVPAKAIRAGPYCVSEQRELLQIVTQHKADRPFTVALHDALPLMQLSLQSGCTLCEACFRVCPTAAIDIVQSPQEWSLTFQADRCVACEVCLEVCQARVLDAQPALDARPGQAPITLIRQAMQRCVRCDRHFVSPEPQQTCTICGDDKDAFDAIFGTESA